MKLEAYALAEVLREGVARHASGDLAGARALFQAVVDQAPEALPPRLALASVCLALQEAPFAVELLRERATPGVNDPVFWHALAVAEEAAGDYESALAHYGQALHVAPDFPDALLNRTALYLRQGESAAALGDARRLVALRSFSFQAQFNLGEAHTAAWAMDDACPAYARALRLSPKNARVMLHYGFALACAGRYAAAQILLDEAGALDSALLADYRRGLFGVVGAGEVWLEARLEARALHLLADYGRIERADWSARDAFMQRFAAFAAQVDEPALAFRALALGLPGAVQLGLSRRIAAAVARAIGPAQCTVLPASRGDAARRIRVGYLSPDFRLHPTSLLLGEMLAWHDRKRFEIIAYSLAADDGSAARQRVLQGADRVVDLSAVDDASAARQIAADDIDLLLDLGGYNDGARPGILARRPARLQLAWLSFMATSGAPWIDYVLVDPVAVPDAARADFSEACLRLPGTFFPCAYAASCVTPGLREDFALPAGKRLLAALHAPYKIDPQTFADWLELLRHHADCVLVLLAARPEAQRRLAAYAAAAGVEADRLCFVPALPHAEHLVRLACCDLVLDTPQCNGGTSTADALVAGTPVLTLAGETLAQRMAASLLHAAGQADMVTCTRADYVARAQALLSEPGGLRAQRERLAAARGNAQFFAPRRWLATFETALAAVWERHCRGLSPANLDVPA